MQYITGMSTVAGNQVIVTFDHDPTAPIVANTCGRELRLSTSIENKQAFFQSMDTIIAEVDFTMP